MKPKEEWQYREILEHELRRPAWRLILDRKGSDLLRDLAIVALDQLIHDFGA